jgi:hypothetical protein
MKRIIVLIGIVSVPIYFYVFWYLLRDWIVGWFFFELFVTGSISNVGASMFDLGLILSCVLAS